MDEAAGRHVALDVPFPNAWFANFGTSVSRILGSRTKETSKIVAEIVLGADDRIRVSPTQTFPYRWICSPIITANGTIWQGQAGSPARV